MTASDTKKYKAPALKKGLEILELLSREDRPLSLSLISVRLKRSRSEIFRMIQELEQRGYILRSESGDGYVLSNRLFQLGMERPKIRSLLDAALPEMRALSQEIGQSCHLAVLSGDQIVVIARNEAPTPVTFSVRVGYRQQIHLATSGVILFAYQPKAEQDHLLDLIARVSKEFHAKEFLAIVNKARTAGYYKSNSPYVKGVIDIAAPIMRNEFSVAALTSPCLSIRGDEMSIKDRIAAITGSAERISLAIAHQ